MPPAAELKQQAPHMENPHLFSVLADMVLVLHFAVAVFVVAGLPAIVIGNALGWRWVNTYRLRFAHLAAIGIIVLQAWCGKYCALTDLESWLRTRAGGQPYGQSFIGHWLQRILYCEAPMWAFALVYTAFGLLVLWAWLRFPPAKRQP
jgi:hypothetical protein